jgi:hypothetical protein
MSFHHLFLPSVHFSVRSDTSALIFYLKTLLVCSHQSGSGLALARSPLLPLFYILPPPPPPKLSSLELKSNLCASKWSLVLPKSNFSMAESSFLPQIEPLSCQILKLKLQDAQSSCAPAQAELVDGQTSLQPKSSLSVRQLCHSCSQQLIGAKICGGLWQSQVRVQLWVKAGWCAAAFGGA